MRVAWGRYNVVCSWRRKHERVDKADGCLTVGEIAAHARGRLPARFVSLRDGAQPAPVRRVSAGRECHEHVTRLAKGGKRLPSGRHAYRVAREAIRVRWQGLIEIRLSPHPIPLPDGERACPGLDPGTGRVRG